MGTAQFFCFRVPVCLFRVGPCAQAEVMRRIKRRKTGAAGTSSVRRTCAGTPRGVMGKASRLKYEIKSVFRIRYCLLVRLGMDIVFWSALIKPGSGLALSSVRIVAGTYFVLSFGRASVRRLCCFSGARLREHHFYNDCFPFAHDGYFYRISRFVVIYGRCYV